MYRLDIKPLARDYERKKRLETKNQSIQNKQPSIRNQFFKSYLQGNKMIDITIELDISAPKAEKLYFGELKLNRMDECYEFYEEHSYDIPTLLTIDHFMKRNNISGPDIVNVLRKANSVIYLNQTILNLKGEIEKLKQNKK
jgi:hypothetical protein